MTDHDIDEDGGLRMAIAMKDAIAAEPPFTVQTFLLATLSLVRHGLHQIECPACRKIEAFAVANAILQDHGISIECDPDLEHAKIARKH